MNVALPLRSEFGLKVWWYVPAVHALPGPKAVYHEIGEEALYPSADHLIEVPRRQDDLRRNNFAKDAEFVAAMEADARRRFGHTARMHRPTDKFPRKRFVPQPTIRQGINCDVVVCPRKREYGKGKNWDGWPELTRRLCAEGLSVFAGGVADSSYDVPCVKAWDFGRGLDATIEAMHAARLVVATDAGLAHLAVLCGRPLLMITHAAGLVAPGEFVDERGKAIKPEYWPVHVHRYIEGNHTGSPFHMLHHAWMDVDVTFNGVMGLLK